MFDIKKLEKLSDELANLAIFDYNNHGERGACGDHIGDYIELNYGERHIVASWLKDIANRIING